MLIDKLSENAVKIHLDREDFQKYNINCSDINSIKKFLATVSEEISDILEADITAERLFVEVFLRKYKCTIFVSTISYHLQNNTTKKQSGTLICEFDSFPALENFCHALNSLYRNSIENSSLTCSANKLRMILKINDEYSNIRYFTSGYGRIIPDDEINAAVTQEYYREISTGNAIDEILLSIRK